MATSDAQYFALLRAWLTAEMGAVYGSDSCSSRGTSRLCLGFPLWGSQFRDMFERHFVESAFSGENLAALRGRTRLVLFVLEAELASGMTALVDKLEGRGILTSLRIIPAAVVAASEEKNPLGGARRYPLLSVVHNLMIKIAARCGSGYSMAMPDQVYSMRYWPRFFEMTAVVPAIVQTTISARLEPAAAELRRWRSPSGALSVPARDLGDLALRNIHPQMHGSLANGSEDYPRHHFLYWRGRDFIEIAYANGDAAWLSPDLCRAATTKLYGTIDAELPHFIGAAPCAVPTLENEMVYAELSGSDKPAVPGRSTKFEYAALAWNNVDWRDEYLPFLAVPHRIPVSTAEEGDYMSGEEITAAHADLVEYVRVNKEEARRRIKVGISYAPRAIEVPQLVSSSSR